MSFPRYLHSFTEAEYSGEQDTLDQIRQDAEQEYRGDDDEDENDFDDEEDDDE